MKIEVFAVIVDSDIIFATDCISYVTSIGDIFSTKAMKFEATHIL